MLRESFHSPSRAFAGNRPEFTDFGSWAGTEIDRNYIQLTYSMGDEISDGTLPLPPFCNVPTPSRFQN